MLSPENKENKSQTANSVFHEAYTITMNDGARARALNAEKVNGRLNDPGRGAPESQQALSFLM